MIRRVMGPCFTFQDFKKIELQDQSSIQAFLRKFPQKISTYTFAHLLSWENIYKLEWLAVSDELLLISCVPTNDDGKRHLLQPIGDFSKEFQETVFTLARGMNYPLKIFDVSQNFCEKYRDFVTLFDLDENRDGANYVYLAKDLAFLQGSKYAKKRNHISQAESGYGWTVGELTRECGPACIKILENLSYPDVPTGTLENERETLRTTMQHFGQLNQYGIMVKVNGQPVAFSIFEELNPSTAVVRYEKANRALRGIYQIVNQETARIIYEKKYCYINREEDMGDDGLRHAKLSYHPATLEPAYILKK